MTVLSLLVLGVALRSAVADGPRPGSARRRDWPMASYDAIASGHNRKEHRLGPDNVGQLEVKWIFDDEHAGHKIGPVHATPVVGDDTVYVGSNFGRFYAVGRDGQLRWVYETRQPSPLLGMLVIPSPIGGQVVGAVATPVVGAAVLPATVPYVIFGDLDGNVYALDRDTGREVWVAEKVDPHPLGGVIGNSLVLAGRTVIVGFSSVENFALALPGLGIPYDCCTHPGLVVALDVATGRERWRHQVIPAGDMRPLPPSLAPFKVGPSGGDVWGQPTVDRKTNTLYFGTGQNFSPSASGGTPASDSIIALDAATGEPRWAQQLTANDIWVNGIPNPGPDGRFLDQDVGDSPKLYRLKGRRVVGAGQKNGAYHVLDARTGDVVASTSYLQMANDLGGFQQGGALAYNMVFQHGLDGLDRTTDSGPWYGVVMALSLDGATMRWRWQKYRVMPAGSLAVANGVLYFQTTFEEADAPKPPYEWDLYALNARTGAELKRMSFTGRALTSPVVARGRVYVGRGNNAIMGIGEDTNGGIVCLGLPGD